MGVYIRGATKEELEQWLYQHGIIWDSRDLVEVPVPHGRLIDADKIEKDIEHYHLSDGKFQYWVEIQPTVIEAEDE